jgi:sugar lactone lactonase YvrE
MWTPLTDSLSELGESPFWHPVERSLYWLDIAGRRVLRTRGDIGHPVIERWAMPAEPGCMAPARGGGWVIALRDGIYRAREWGGALDALARVDHDARTMRFNDGKCDPLGRFWAGTVNEAKDGASAALYCLDARGGRAPVLTRMLDGVTTANGLAFAPKDDTLYWADTQAHRVCAWRWDAQANALSGARVFRQFDAKPEGWTLGCALRYGGRPDGAAIDAEGHYWVAMFEGGRLLRFAPSGELASSLPLPAPCPTMPCFGGDDLRTLFVTTARRDENPLSGQVLAARVATPGLPVDFFED